MRLIFFTLALIVLCIAASDAQDISAIRDKAEAGDAAAQFELGAYYESRSDNERDQRRAIDWYEKSAKQDFAAAQFHLGRMYILGKGAGQDTSRGVEWQLKAAEQGLAEAQYVIGKRFLFGVGVEKDFDRALELIGAAADQGVVDAQNQLGQVYFQGEAVAKDLVQAYKWFIISAQSDDPTGRRYLGVLEEVLDEAQMEQAKSLVLEWQEVHATAHP